MSAAEPFDTQQHAETIRAFLSEFFTGGFAVAGVIELPDKPGEYARVAIGCVDSDVSPKAKEDLKILISAAAAWQHGAIQRSQ